MTKLIILLVLLQVKHFICDFPLQKPYMYLNKGKFGHSGGLLHALVHGIGTWLVVSLIVPALAVPLAVLDMTVHYFIDYSKVKINTHFKLKPDNSEWFWILLGLDQMLHQLTYILLFIIAKDYIAL